MKKIISFILAFVLLFSTASTAYACLTWNNKTLPQGAVGEFYSTVIAVSSDGPASASQTGGTLPPGLSVTLSNPVINDGKIETDIILSGTPTTAGDFSFSIRAEDECGAETEMFSIKIVSSQTEPQDPNDPQDPKDPINGVRSPEVVKLISNLRNHVAAPSNKLQLAWIAQAAGNTQANYANDANWNRVVNPQFSYEFENMDGTIKGRVQGDRGTLTIQSLGANGEYTTVTSGAVYDFANQFTQHFSTMTAFRHDHQHTINRVNTNYNPENPGNLHHSEAIAEQVIGFDINNYKAPTSVERFPINHQDVHVSARPSNERIVFFYNLATAEQNPNMLAAMVLGGQVKYVNNFSNYLALPSRKAQLSWIARGAGNTAENFANDNNFTNTTVTGAFTYEFESLSNSAIKGRVQGDNGTITVFARQADGSYTAVTDGEVFDFANQYIQYFATITATGHTHNREHTVWGNTNGAGFEVFPIRLGYLAPNNDGRRDAEKCISFVHSPASGPMIGMVLPEGFSIIEGNVTADKTELQNKISAALSLSENNFSNNLNNWARLQAILSNANRVNTNPNANQSAVNSITSALQSRIERAVD